MAGKAGQGIRGQVQEVQHRQPTKLGREMAGQGIIVQVQLSQHRQPTKLGREMAGQGIRGGRSNNVSIVN